MTTIAGISATEYHRNYYYIRRAKLMALVGDKCARCGSTHDLQFDHIDPAEKSFEISNNLTATNPEVIAELAKCQMLCRDCHLAKTAMENSGMTHGGWYAFLRMMCQCEECSVKRRAFYEERNAARRIDGGKGKYNQPAEHGTILMYRRKCRCDLCRRANADYAQELKRRA